MIQKFTFQHPDLNSKAIQIKQAKLILFYHFPLIIKTYWFITFYIVFYIFFFGITYTFLIKNISLTFTNVYFLSHIDWVYNSTHEFTWLNFFAPKIKEYIDINPLITHYPLTPLLGRANITPNSQPSSDIIQNQLRWLFHGKWVFYSFHWEPFFFGVQNFKTLFAMLTLNKNNLYATYILEQPYYFIPEWLKTPKLNLNSFIDLIQKLCINSHRNLRRHPELLINYFDNSYYPTDLELKYQFDKFLFHMLLYDFDAVPHLGARDIDEIDNLHKSLVQYKNSCFNNSKTIKNGKLITSDFFEHFQELEKVFDNYYFYRQRHSNINSPEAQLLEYYFNVKFYEIKLFAKDNIVTTFNKNFDLLRDKVYPISSYNQTYEYIKISRLTTKYILVQEQMINHFFW